MTTRTDEIAPGIHRVSTFVPDVGPRGLTSNQFLLVTEQPLLSHTGPRAMFPAISQAVSRVGPLAKLRWIAFGHVESDEWGELAELYDGWLASA